MSWPDLAVPAPCGVHGFGFGDVGLVVRRLVGCRKERLGHGGSRVDDRVGRSEPAPSRAVLLQDRDRVAMCAAPRERYLAHRPQPGAVVGGGDAGSLAAHRRRGVAFCSPKLPLTLSQDQDTFFPHSPMWT